MLHHMCLDPTSLSGPNTGRTLFSRKSISHVNPVMAADGRLPFSDPKWDYNTLTVDDVFRAIQSNPGQIDVSLHVS
jgi:hypothetical protein